MLTNIELERAQDIILNHVTVLQVESLPLLQALGRVVSEDVLAEHDLPPYAQAAMDGYAVPEGECGQYRVIERLLPGEMPGASLGPGQATGVATGGPLPDGVVAVVPQEAVEINGEYITYNGAVVYGSNIKPPGENFRKGDLLVRQGASLSPGMASVLAAYGKNEVTVYRKPQVAILSLGPDIISCRETPAPGQMRDSNGLHLAALVMQEQGQVIGVEVAGADSTAQIGQRFQKLLHCSDLLITIGGAAHGIGDQAFPLLKHNRADLLFWGIKIKPGSHSGAAAFGEKLVISLSGNPAACAVGYHLLVAPVLRAMQNLKPYQAHLSAESVNVFLKKGGPRRFLLASATCDQSGWSVIILPGQKSSMTQAFLRNCNALIDLPAGHPPVEKGAKLSIVLTRPAYGGGQ
ncbi:MAG: Molybdopterin molybdenumtransferase [Pelotomaculum sp. PtaB.Bin104]|nr:MAG: Molybdopterin molybdenumtransferase [Pelotomaculum sp. PtaB.Bin104]